MSEDQIISSVLLPALRVSLRELPGQAEFGAHTPLFGHKGAVLDSLALINFIFDVEARLAEKTGHNIKFEMDEIVREVENPFRTVGALGAFLGSKLKAKA